MGAQAQLIIAAQEGGLSHASSPNRRLFLELGLIIGWLDLERNLTVEAMLRKAENETDKFLKKQTGVWAERERALHEPLKALLPLEGDLSRDYRANVKAMSDAVAGGDGMYFMWWEERDTRITHSTSLSLMPLATRLRP